MRIFAVMIGAVMWAAAALAQSPDEVVWVQIEAHPSLTTATQRAQAYTGAVEDVNGFALGRGWYAIALGPYRREDAAQVLRVYRAEGLIPSDAYIALPATYRQQFWPVGANVLEQPPQEAPVTPEPETDTTAEAAPAQPVVPDETPAQARRSEGQLNRAEREELQIALKWAGTYTGAIDGAFGRGTRGAMRAWQQQQNLEDTGILTTAQRAELLRQYNAVLDGLGLTLVVNADAGIEMQLPTEVVRFARNQSPFAHYDGTGAVEGARVLFISQDGGRDALAGLYEIMQTLEIVPLDGPRERQRDSFLLVGENDRIVSETRVSLTGGAIKGFTLIWPAGDEERRTRLIEEMDASFRVLPGTLDPAAGEDAAQAIDLVAGLAVRTPRLSRSGFFIDDSGTVLTTAEAVQNCTRITLDEETRATVLAEAGAVAVLKPAEALAPLEVARLSLDSPRLGSDVAVAGYSFEGRLNAPSVTFGTFAEARGLDGDDAIARLEAQVLPGDAGGPVLDGAGAVVGMLLPRTDGGRTLPDAVALAVKSAALAKALSITDGAARAADTEGAALSPAALADRGAGMTVLVSCWD